ncbi:MAG TPA: ABC-three component system protein [Sphingobacterium bovisgrunnientis]|nr:ABC-three component system protein [Sphingobacterium bovisgrunnientis]
MFSQTQKGIDIAGDNSKVVGGDDHSTTTHYHSYSKHTTKLSNLFDRLDQEYNSDNKIDEINDDLQRYLTERDTIGLEQKLLDGNIQHLYEDAMWLKEEYSKKLTKYVFFEPAQQIHAYLLAIVIEKFRNLIYPLFREGKSEAEIMKAVSENINTPLLDVIREEGCNDIMGLNATDIDGMIYFLTGRCHIKWNI